MADVPQSINYQGRLTNTSGQPVADGPYLVKFIIYDADVDGVAKWNSGFQTINTNSGIFDVQLGVPPMPLLPDNLFADTFNFLGITVNTDPEISPKTKFLTVPYAYQALRADTAMYLGTFSASDFALTGHTHNGGNHSGIAFKTSNSWYSFGSGGVVPSGVYIIDSIDIICPDQGYVVVTGFVGWVNILHETGKTDDLWYQVNNQSDFTGFTSGTMIKKVPDVLPTSSYNYPFYSVNYFNIPSAGTYRYYSLFKYENSSGSGVITGHSFSLSAVYHPTSYGSTTAIEPMESNTGKVLKTTLMENTQ
jgi:hypothetical protein